MNFPPLLKSWLVLVTTALSTGLAAGVTSFLGGCSRGVAALVGVGVAASNVLHGLQSSPSDKNPPVTPPAP